MLRKFLYQVMKKQPYGTQEIVPINKITIPDDFKKRESCPAKWKMVRARQMYHKLGFIDKPILVMPVYCDYDSLLPTEYILQDSYTRYLVLLENGISKAPIVYAK